MSTVQKLKLSLMTAGMTVTARARRRLSGSRGKRPLTLADYASTSGISMELDGGVWVNAAFADHNANFVRETSNELDFTDGDFFIRTPTVEVPCVPLPVPDYHDECCTVSKKPYTDFAITHTDRVRISPIQGCSYVCTFCDLPYKKNDRSRANRYERMDVKGLIESVGRALVDAALPAQHVLISGGVPLNEDWDYLNEIYRQIPARFAGVAVDVMMVPVPGMLDVDQLYDHGIHGLSINLELYDEDRAAKIMPHKARLGRAAWLDFIERAVVRFGPGRVRSLLMVGLEPIEATLQGVEALARRGCDPVLSPFRPDPATPMRAATPPTAAFLEEVYLRASDITERLGVKLGPRCTPCMHNTLTFDDGSGCYAATKSSAQRSS